MARRLVWPTASPSDSRLTLTVISETALRHPQHSSIPRPASRHPGIVPVPPPSHPSIQTPWFCSGSASGLQLPGGAFLLAATAPLDCQRELRTIDPSEGDVKAGNHSSAVGRAAQETAAGRVRPRHGRIAAMVAYARRKFLGGERQAVFHCWNRCVRRAFLCGRDSHTGTGLLPSPGLDRQPRRAVGRPVRHRHRIPDRTEQPPPPGAPHHAAGGQAVVGRGSGPPLADHHQTGQVLSRTTCRRPIPSRWRNWPRTRSWSPSCGAGSAASPGSWASCARTSPGARTTRMTARGIFSRPASLVASAPT